MVFYDNVKYVVLKLMIVNVYLVFRIKCYFKRFICIKILILLDIL